MTPYRRIFRLVFLFISFPCALVLFVYYRDSNPVSYYKTLKSTTAAVLVGDSIYIGGRPKVTARLMYGKLQNDPTGELYHIGLKDLYKYNETHVDFSRYVQYLHSAKPIEFSVWKSRTGNKLYPRAKDDNRNGLIFRHFLLLGLFKLPILGYIIIWGMTALKPGKEN